MFRKGTIKYPDMTAIFTVTHEYEAELIRELLAQNSIPSHCMDREDAGGYLRIIGHGSPFGIDIYVNKDQAETAKKLIQEHMENGESLTDEELEKAAMEAETE